MKPKKPKKKPDGEKKEKTCAAKKTDKNESEARKEDEKADDPAIRKCEEDLKLNEV
ncbi:unnamed protein product [Gongylonema pulchrum]|uniref:Uncharacterized protein n=1 Tax=Gongylonema pulchrum TaxID=637853 RepID=A0A3P7NDG5_9BILA|nr:unnamed protein product [Gongylonema pulchrum]